MRLIECNVKGFGALSDFRVSFDAGVNVIMQPNGWGKTTLAAFIKAMLYGFESRRSRDVMQNERLRYAPWAGGHYGGSLDFESGGREYRVTRSFGKTAAGDKERVVDIETGERVDFMTPTVGEWLFGIDSEAFKKSVFIGQDAFESSWESASLRNRLNSIVNEADDVGGLDGALKVLDDCRKVYKKTGGRGRIADSSAKIATLVGIQTEAEAKIEEVTRLIEARKQAVDQQAALSAAIHTDREKLNGIKDELSRRKTQGEVRAKLEAAVEESEKKLDEFTLNAGKTLPSAESLEIAKRALAAYEEAGGEEAESLSALDDIVERRRALSEGFGGRIPSPEEVDGQKDLVRRWREARDELILVEGKAAPAERPSFAVFRGDPDAVSQVSGIVADWGEMSASLDRLAKAEREIAVESARWEEQSRRVRDALESVRLKRAALSANADLLVADLRQRAGRLKELDRERVALSAEEDSLKAQIDELAATEALGSPDAEEEFAGLLGQLDEAIGRCSAADEAALAARDAELEYAREKELRRTELEAAREAKESKSTSASGDAGTKRPIAALVACVVAAVALALAGFAARPGSPASIGVWALAAIVAVAGGAIWVRGSKRSGASDEGEECVDQSVEQAEEAYRQASIREESARAATEKTQSEAGLAREALETLLRKPPCEGGSDDASLIARASLAKERLANRIAAAEKASRLGKAHAAAEVRLSEIDAEIGKIRSVVDGFDADPDLDAERLAERFEQLAVKIQRDIDEARSEERRLAQALVQLAGVECSSDLSDCEAAAQKALDAPPDTLSRLIDLRRDLRGSVDQYSERVADWAGKLLPKTGSRPSVAENVDVLKGELSAYQSYCREVGEIQKGSEMLRDEIERIGKELASWSNLLGATLDAATNGSLFESLGRVLQQDSRLRWEESEARSRLAQASDRRQALKRQVGIFPSSITITRSA